MNKTYMRINLGKNLKSIKIKLRVSSPIIKGISIGVKKSGNFLCSPIKIREKIVIEELSNTL